MLTLDHIAISAETLTYGVPDVEEALGVELAAGGQHEAMGTHNKLLSLGPEEYLEVIAVDPEAKRPNQPRWFDLDNFIGATRATTWICRVPDLDAALASSPEGAGAIWPLQRGDLSWRMAIPKNGKLPFDGLFPALIQWEGSAHPAPRLPDRDIRLARLRLVSPEAGALKAALAPLIQDPRLEIVGGATADMTVVLQTPAGQVAL